MNTTMASSDVTADRSSSRGRRVGALQEPRDRPGDGQGHHEQAEGDEAALDDPSAGQVLAVGVEQQDAHHDADAEGQDDDRQVLGLEAEGLPGEVRPEHAEHADERGRDPQVQQRPADRVVAADEADALAQLVGRVVEGAPGLAHRVRAVDLAGARPAAARAGA